LIAYRSTPLVPLAVSGDDGKTTPVTGARVIGGLTPRNVIPDEIFTDHPKRFRAMLVVEISDRMQRHVSLPNGLGVDFPTEAGGLDETGVAPNALTAPEDRDWLAGAPWRKSVPARIEAMGT
jgi:hypothetical protein